MKNRLKTSAGRSSGALVAAAVFLATLQIHAGIVLNSPEMWTTTGNLSGWTNTSPIGSDIATLGNTNHFLAVTFPTQGGPPVDQQDVIYASGSSYTGDYSVAAMLGFDFYAEDLISPLTQVYLHSAVDNTTWSYTFAVTTTGRWESFIMPLTYTPSWSGPGGASQFAADLANIDWVGIYVMRNSGLAQQDYGIDNWGYYENTGVPEPGALAVLSTFFLSFAILFRRRLIKDTLPLLHSRISDDAKT